MNTNTKGNRMGQVVDTAASSVLERYAITKAEIIKAVKESDSITVSGAEDTQGMELARSTRLSLRKIRTTIEAKRKELKADALAYGRKVDEVARDLSAPIGPAEERLKVLEETAEREKSRREEEDRKKRETEAARRCELLTAIGVTASPITLQFVSTEEFEKLYATEKAEYDAKKKAEAEADAARKAEAERLEKVAAEQAAKQAEIEAKEAEIAAKQAAIEKAEQEKRERLLGWRTTQLAMVNASMDQDEMLALCDEDFEELLVVKRKEEDKRKADEAKAEAFRKEQEAKAEKERIAAAAKEEADRLERERLAEFQRKEAEAKVAEEERARIAALAPDREKVAAYRKQIARIDAPELSSEGALERLNDILDSFLDGLQELSKRLEEGSVETMRR